MAKITVTRYHDISCGHRVHGHESKCKHLHGHNYRVHFECTADTLDAVGRVIDFSVVKEKLCMWIEEHWDHKFLAWECDPVMVAALQGLREIEALTPMELFGASMVWLPFNPTAENMADYLVNVVGPKQLEGTGVELVHVTIEETAKCHVHYHKG